MFLWLAGIIVYDHVCVVGFLNMLNVNVMCTFAIVRSR
jgi:hypothetical protein